MLQQIGDTAALEHDAAAGDFRGVRREDRIDADAAKESRCLFGSDSRLTHAAKRAAQVTALDTAGGRGVFAQLMGEPAAFTVVGLGEVDELEVEAERTCQLIRSGEIKGADAGERLIEICGGSSGIG